MKIRELILLLVICFFAITKCPALSIPFDSLKIRNDTVSFEPPLLSLKKYYYLNPSSPDTVTRNTILWLPLKDFQNIFDYIPGYFLTFSDVGQQTQLEFGQIGKYHVNVLRHGRQINDLIDGQPDLNLISRNEIAEIEFSGSSIYSTFPAVNILDRQILRNRPYTEIAYWQDRYENLYFDGNFHKNIFKKLNFNFGITKHSFDGKYSNSDYDKWQGRFNLNYIGSKKFNSFLSVNYSHILRGLNGGLDPSVNTSNPDSVFNPEAKVKYEYDRDDRTRFDIDLGVLFVYGEGKNNFTKLHFFTGNSFRVYNDDIFKENTHWIEYGAKLTQNFRIDFSKVMSLNSKSEAETDFDIIRAGNKIFPVGYKRYIFSQSFLLRINSLDIESRLQTNNFSYYNSNFYSSGRIEGRYYLGDSLELLSANVAYSFSSGIPYYKFTKEMSEGVFNLNPEVMLTELFTASIGAVYKHNNIRLIYNYYTEPSGSRKIILHQIGGNADFNYYGFRLQSCVTFNLRRFSNNPFYFGNVNFSYSDIFFRKKFRIKAGVTSKFWGKFEVDTYNGWLNSYSGPYVISSTSNLMTPANATLDLFIIGQIDKATFGFTFENILNRVIFNTGIYPYQDRGGLFKALSRFNVTWHFFD